VFLIDARVSASHLLKKDTFMSKTKALSPDSKGLVNTKMAVKTKKSWLSAIHSARERIRKAQGSEIAPETRPQRSSAEILGSAMRIREEFKAAQKSNARMLQALAEFKARRSNLRDSGAPSPVSKQAVERAPTTPPARPARPAQKTTLGMWLLSLPAASPLRRFVP
jgi:hypothetical protein